jgi:hypothetical protein
LIPSADDAWAAAQVVGAFWQALAEGDDASAVMVTTAGIHEEVGTEPGFASRLRERLGIDQGACARVGVSSKVRVLQGQMIFPCLDVGEGGQTRPIGTWGPVTIEGWLLQTAVEGGRWRVSGRYLQAAEGWPADTEYIDLPTAPAPEGPIQ